MSQMPSWLQQALAESPPRSRGTAHHSPRPGDIRLAEPMDASLVRPQLVIVLSVDEEPGVALIAPLSSDLELATEADALLPSEDSGLPYDVVVQCDLFATVWVVQLGPVKGQLGTDLLLEILRATEEGVPPATQAGPELVTAMDPRWQLREQQLRSVRMLAGDCTRQLLDGELHTTVDTAALWPQPDEDPVGFFDFVLIVLDRVRHDDVLLPTRALEHLTSASEGLTQWRRLGLMDAYRTLTSILNERLLALETENVPEYAPDGDIQGRRVDGTDPLHGQLDEEWRHGHRCVRVLTRQHLWQPANLGHPVRATLGETRFQLIPITTGEAVV